MSKRRRDNRSERSGESSSAAPPEPAGVSGSVLEGSGARSGAASAAGPGPGDGGWLAALAALVPGLVALGLYWLTLAPTVATGDSGELTTVAVNLGLAHPPGYPTFTILGHLFSWLPLEDPARRVNLMSAVLSAIAVGTSVVLSGRLILAAAASVAAPAADLAGRHGRAARSGRAALAAAQARPDRTASPVLVWLAAAIGGLSLALSTGFWRYSLVAEVFALSNLLAVVVLLLMLEWSRQPDRMRYLWAAALTSGLALTNQQTIVFAAPALITLLVIGIQRYQAPIPGRRIGRPVPWRAIGIAVGLGVVGLLPYLYLPLAAAAGAATPWGDPTTPGGFLGIVTRSAYGTFSFTVRDTSGSPLEHLALFGGYLLNAFTLPGIALGIVGFAWLAAKRGGEALALGLWILITGPLFLLIANPPLSDPVTRGVLERFYLLPSLPLAVMIAVGAWRACTAIAQRIPAAPATARAAGLAAAAVLVAAQGVLAAVRLPEVDESDNRVAERYAGDLLASLPAEAILLMRSDENFTSVSYAQGVRGLRPDVLAIDVELLKIASYVEDIEAANPDVFIPFAQYDGGRATSLGSFIDEILGDRPVYLAGALEEDLSTRFDLVDEGLVDRIHPDGEEPDPLAALRADPGIFERLNPPQRPYPESTWEAAIAANYADVAFDTGVALQALGPQANADEVERLYRAAIALTPSLASAYKNLGLLYQANGGPASEIIAVWEEYLELRPDDPEAGAIQSAIDRLRSGATPAPSS